MISNHFIMCNSCSTTINLRSQAGYSDIPYNINCPKCSTHIYGKVIFNQENAAVSLEVENASIKHVEIGKDDKYYSAELSSEFPTRKMYFRSFAIADYDGTPFIRNPNFYSEDSQSQHALESSLIFSATFIKRWKKIQTYFNLFWNNQISFLYPKLEEELTDYNLNHLLKVDNKLDCIMALHHLLLTTTGLPFALPEDTLSEYNDIANIIFQDKNKREEIQKFANTISSDINDIEKKSFKLINSFSKLYEQLIPVVALRNSNSLWRVDKEKYGITTANFEELSDFYAKSYEWILDNIDIIIALNNVECRNSYIDCSDGKNFKNVLEIRSKIKKIEYIDDIEPFSTPTNSLNNKYRNAIQHFSNEIDYVSQKITFTDKHAGKVKQESMYLIEFADLCIENFSIIIYILELIYQIRRNSYIMEGLVPSLNPKEFTKKTNKRFNGKIGRNVPCPCGSGKKYKKCCI